MEGIWIDSRGSFLAAADAGPVYRLPGKKDLETKDFSGEAVALIEADIAFRQHEGGHTVEPNWPTFLKWAERHIKVLGKNKVISETIKNDASIINGCIILANDFDDWINAKRWRSVWNNQVS